MHHVLSRICLNRIVTGKTNADVPEGAIIIREHTPMTNLFSCLWFNEVNRFTPRDQLSFGYVVYKLKDQFPFFMFPNCESNSLALLHKHMREHSSKVEWVKNLEELKEGNTMVETRGGIGLWTPANNLSVYEYARNTSNLKWSWTHLHFIIRVGRSVTKKWLEREHA